jgi:hypothetical protein
MSIGREIEDIARDLIKHQHAHPPGRDLNRETERRLTLADRIAMDFTSLVGSWVFVLAQIGLMLVWVVLNALSLIRHWDPYPFQFLNFVLTFEIAAWLLLVLIKAEEELKALMNHLMHQDEILLQIVNRLDRSDREIKRVARLLENAQENRSETKPETPRSGGPERPMGVTAP